MRDVHAFLLKGIKQGRGGQVVPAHHMAVPREMSGKSAHANASETQKKHVLRNGRGHDSGHQRFEFVHHSGGGLGTRSLRHGASHARAGFGVLEQGSQLRP